MSVWSRAKTETLACRVSHSDINITKLLSRSETSRDGVARPSAT